MKTKISLTTKTRSRFASGESTGSKIKNKNSKFKLSDDSFRKTDNSPRSAIGGSSPRETNSAEEKSLTSSSSSQSSRGSSIDSPADLRAKTSISQLTKSTPPSSLESLTHKRFNSPAKVSSSGNMIDENFLQDFLNAHNYYRKKHGVHVLQLNNKVRIALKKIIK